MQYKQLTYEQRCQITEPIKKGGGSQRDMPSSQGVNQSTISRGLARNKGGRGYHHKQAQSKAVQRRLEAAKSTRMTPSMMATIESKIGARAGVGLASRSA
jgi:IS30 family transposase